MARASMFAALQRLIPKRALTTLLGALAWVQAAMIKNTLISLFMRAYDVDMTSYTRKRPEDFESFRDFFTRELAPGARPIAEDPAAVVSPVDGFVSQTGRVEHGTMIQAKGSRYDLSDLLACVDGDTPDPAYGGAWFATIYLAPRDYHRVHSPIACALEQTVEVPGALYSVNAATEAGVDRLFCRNERLVCHMRSGSKPFALVLVGAMIVATIETTWHGPRSPYRIRLERTPDDVRFDKGAEVGRFTLGSTVILVVPDAVGRLDGLQAGRTVRMGETIGTLASASSD